jgi:2-polyprenyl-6-methoxyphenol hydroxylase-like FAD-dependent oxidoreductase
MLTTDTDVLIVGAGPTGTALAIALQQAGVSHLLIDKLEQGQNTSRAAVIHAHTLEMLEELGVSDELARRGMKLANFVIRDRDRSLVQLRFDQLPSAYRYLLMLPQNETEKVFADRLAALGGSIHRGVTATAATQDAEGVRIRLETPKGETSVKARYVVGGDGMHSIVRSAAGIEFEGGTYGESFVLADVRMQWSLGASEVSLFFSPAGVVVVAPLPDGTFRIVATLDNAPEQPGIADIQALLDARGPTIGQNRIEEVVWSSRFRVHHRVAKSYSAGRFILMGDAAHVHSPAGGQGMNTGIVDAVVLGRLLADVVKGKRPEGDLASYGEMRRPAATKVLGLAGMLTSMATLRGTPKRTLRNAVLSLINLLPPAKRRLQMNLSGLARKQLTEVPGVAH